MILFSPAKINLFLKVLHKRNDGYHEIVSLMQAVSLFDEITLETSEEDQFSVDHPTLKFDENNLIFKALKLFRQETGILAPVKVHLKKKIPIGAGLGGGSSNAATMLFGLQSLFKTDLNLKALSAEIGSDVPFFFSSGFALAKGRGEQIEELKFTYPLSCFLSYPGFPTPTPLIYQHHQVKNQSCNTDLLIKSFQTQNPIFINDLEETALMLNLDLVKHRQALLSCGKKWLMLSGSGSTFIMFDQVTEIESTNLKLTKVLGVSRKSDQWYASM